MLDGPASVVPGGVLRTGAAPYRPRTAAVTVPALHGAPTAAEVMDSLSRAVRAPLAGPGRETSEVARDTDIRFESAARPVYYAGLRFVTASFRYRCAGDRTVRGEGGVLTWETDSLTVGLVDCAGPRDHDPDSEPARRAASLRCPPGRPAPTNGVS